MTLVRDGWIDGRGYYVIRDTDTGAAAKYMCERCEGEIEPDPDVFAAHNCENYRKRETASVDATEGAMELARDKGVTLSGVEGTGKDGRVTKADVEREVE